MSQDNQADAGPKSGGATRDTISIDFVLSEKCRRQLFRSPSCSLGRRAWGTAAGWTHGVVRQPHKPRLSAHFCHFLRAGNRLKKKEAPCAPAAPHIPQHKRHTEGERWERGKEPIGSLSPTKTPEGTNIDTVACSHRGLPGTHERVHATAVASGAS